MKLSSVAGWLLGLTLPATAAEPYVAVNNLAHEYAVCAAYFGVVSIAFENSNDPATAAQYTQLMNQALAYALASGDSIGLLQETTASRYKIAIEEMQDRIDGNTSNISVLYGDYMKSCTVAMEDPEGRFGYWLGR
ncbi:hypothetical protein [Pannonibacter sp.]|uniref:hypothetical protein n=1 Tax=Pannonibacter sp. TaxID=1906786 RepID=UPI003F6F00ED